MRINQNQRVVPDAVQDYKIQPVATPVDKLERFSPEVAMAGANRDKTLYDALAVFGKGILDTSLMLRRHAGENAIAAQSKAEENKRDWAEVSKNFEGMSKFNPYNKDAFKKLVAADITREYVNNLYADPDLAARTPEEVANMVENNQQDMLGAYTQNGLSQKDYANFLINYSNRGYALKQQHIKDHAEVEFKFVKTKFSDSLGDDIATALFNGNPISNATLNAEKVMDELGWTNQTKAEVVFNGLKAYVAKNPEASPIDIEEFMSTYEIGGNKLTDYMPNGYADMKNFVKQIKRANYDEKHLAYQDHMLDLTIASQEANREMYEWYKANPNAGNAETKAMLESVIENYGLEENGFDYFNTINNSLEKYQDIKSDPTTLQTFAAKAAIGALDGDEIRQAVLDGELNWKDGLQFSDRIDRELKADLQAVKQSYTDLNTKLKKTGIYGSALGEKSKDVQEIQSAANQLTLDLKEGRITPEEAKRGMQDLERIASAKANMKQTKATNDSFLLNANYIKSQQAPAYKAESAIKAFKQLGLERGVVGQKIQPQITSAPNDNRMINGKKAPHKGYDLGATNDTRVHSVNMRGTCVFAGFEPNGFGNYVVIKYDNGTYMRAGHFSTSTKHLQGKTIPAGMYLGNAGSTGFSTGTHLHVDFWNKNRELISVEKFQMLMR